MSTEQTKSESFGFKAEIKQILNILIHSLYQDREIFLRELLSNASDALTRFQFEHLTNQDVLDPDAELAIHLSVEERGEQKLLIVKDSGIGMNRDELVQNLGTIAQSGAREFLQKIGENGVDAGNIADVIGQFGVGFYSVFMVAEEVKVISRSFRPDDTAYAWISQGGETFEVMPADKSERGTEIHITLKDEDFADAFKLRQIIKKHSDFVSYPIYVDGEQANQQESLWRKAPSNVEDKGDYAKFYQQMTMDFEEPTVTVHLHADAPVNVRSLLFVPAKRERNIFSSRAEPGVKLYSKNVLIQEYCTDLLPRWLEFVDGVVDSEDLPLNVSRETVQNNQLMRHLSSTLRKRVLRELGKLAKNDDEKFAQFWGEYSRVLKEGVALDPTAKDDLLPLFHYYSSKSENELTSIDGYIERMPAEQSHIYYVMGDSVASVANSPHLDPFKESDLEVLYWVDPLDPFVAPNLTEYKEKTFQNIESAELELPKKEDEATEKADETAIPEADFNLLVGKFVTVLGDKVTEVRASKVLKNSPIRLVSPEDAPASDMHRVQRLLNQDYEVPKKIVELNRNHPLVADLAHRLTENGDDALLPLAIEQLYESALVQEGLHPNPAEMLPRIQQLIGLAAKS